MMNWGDVVNIFLWNCGRKVEQIKTKFNVFGILNLSKNNRESDKCDSVNHEIKFGHLTDWGGLITQ